MIVLGRLKKRCKWNITCDYASIRKSSLLKIIRNIPSQYAEKTGFYDEYRMTCMPVLRVRLVPVRTSSYAASSWWYYCLASDKAFTVNLKSSETLQLVTQALHDPRTFIRGDGTIRADIVMQKQGNRVFFRLMTDEDTLVPFETAAKEATA